MKKVVVFFRGGLFPVDMGSKRYIVELVAYLNSLPDVTVNLVCMEGLCSEKNNDKYLSFAQNVEWLTPPRRWGLWDFLNKIASRLGIDMLNSFFSSLAVRWRFKLMCENADKVIINYAVWYALLPRCLRYRKCAVITHDLVYYRRASIGGAETIIKRMLIILNRIVELKVLKSYARICVLGDYEKRELIKYGCPEAQIIHTGFPMRTNGMRPPTIKKYDFILMGAGDGGTNVATLVMFFRRVAAVVCPRQISVVVTRSESWDWSRISIPSNVNLVKVGYVDDLKILLSLVRIGIGTIPYGSGVKTKVVESMMNNLPVVATDHALEGIPADESACLNIDHASDDDVSRWVDKILDDDVGSYAIGSANGERLRNMFAPENCLRELVGWIRE